MERAKREPAAQSVIVYLVLVDEGEFELKLLFLDGRYETAVPDNPVDKGNR
jgi:hypothetical protein